MLSEAPSPSHSILVHFGELGLKGRNQPMFRRQLRKNLRVKLRKLGHSWEVQDNVGVLTIHVPDADRTAPFEPILAELQTVSGIAWITHARRIRPFRFTPETASDDLAELGRYLVELAQAQFSPDRTFCVRVNRGNKNLPFRSPELASTLGQMIRERTAWKTVDLKRPDVTFHLDLRNVGTYLYGEKLRGPGGLPVGTSGRVLALLSGGIDSPVAAYLLAKRGCRVDFIHFTVGHVTADEMKESKIWRLFEHLSRFTLDSKLFVVPYTYFDLALLRAQVDFELVLFRRFMVRVAERIASRERARALVTGDNLSQVASQTLSNLVSTSQATQLPILRPLVAFDKEETIALAQKIGTYPISVEPYKDCCALVSRHPKTKSHADRLALLECRAFPDYNKLLERTVQDALCLEL